MIVLVYGYEGSGPGHWQRWLQGELQRRDAAFAFPELSEPLAPDKDRWLAELAQVVEAAAEPVTLVAHSLGCWLVDHFINERGGERLHAALLVAPPSPHLIFEAVDSFLPPPRRREAWATIAAHSLIVSSDNDEFATAAEIEAIATDLNVQYQMIPDAGHINSASGYGPWRFALVWRRPVGALNPRRPRPPPPGARRRAPSSVGGGSRGQWPATGSGPTRACT